MAQGGLSCTLEMSGESRRGVSVGRSECGPRRMGLRLGGGPPAGVGWGGLGQAGAPVRGLQVTRSKHGTKRKDLSGAFP